MLGLVSQRYPELTDDLMHLIPKEYSKKHLGQLISAIWSKYLDLQGGDVKTQRQLLAKDKEIFLKEKEIQDLKQKLSSKSINSNDDEFDRIHNSKKLEEFIKNKSMVLTKSYIEPKFPGVSAARAFGLITPHPQSAEVYALSEKGINFFKWILLHEIPQP